MAREQGMTCIDCRYGSAYTEPEGTSPREWRGAHRQYFQGARDCAVCGGYAALDKGGYA